MLINKCVISVLHQYPNKTQKTVAKPIQYILLIYYYLNNLQREQDKVTRQQNVFNLKVKFFRFSHNQLACEYENFSNPTKNQLAHP